MPKADISESAIQKAIMQWAAIQEHNGLPELKLLYHCPNGGYRNPKEASSFKKMGVKPGVPDLHLPVPKGIYAGLWIELKTQIGKQSEYQKEWEKELTNYGHLYKLCRSVDEAILAITDYLSLDR